ncbi:MAG: transglycosylase domain-containing protein, partial [Gammaproteobacteria bacterium]
VWPRRGRDHKRAGTHGERGRSPVSVFRRRRGWITGAAAGAALAIAAAVLALCTWLDLAPLPAQLPTAGQLLTARLLARDGTPLTENLNACFNYAAQLSLTRIPPLVRNAFVSSEDRRYWQHGGSDWRARLVALWQNLRAGHIVRGASSIGEQAARILTPRPRSYWSHWLDGVEAGRLLAHFGHARVLEFYLNQVPYGGQRRGVAAAAHYYFGRNLAALDPAEQLALAVMVRAPDLYDPRRHPETLQRAVNALALRMQAADVINVTQAQAVRASAITPGSPRLAVAAGPFVAYARARARALGVDAPVIATTLDPQLERFAQDVLRRTLNSLRARGVRDGAALVVNNASGAVLAWAVAPARRASDLDPVLVPRQPGSTLKPFLYALAMQKLGWQPDTVLRDGPLQMAANGGVHPFHNYSDRYYGRVSLRYALGNSLNIPAVETASVVGVDGLLDLLHRLGVGTLTRPADYYGPALAIGDGPVRLFDLTQAYSALARHGAFLPLHVLADAPLPALVAVISPRVSSVIASILSDPDARAAEFGANSVLDLPEPTAVKTGTSSDFRDAWAMGFDNRYTVGVWMGRLDGGYMDRVTGSVGPALVLRSLLARLRTDAPYTGLWRSPALAQVRACEVIGAGPCIARDEWHVVGSAMATTFAARVESARILQPLPGETLALDPRMADGNQEYTFEIRDSAQRVRRVDWFLDGRLLARTVDAVRDWRMRRGTHRLSVEVWLVSGSQPLQLGPVDFSVE